MRTIFQASPDGILVILAVLTTETGWQFWWQRLWKKNQSSLEKMTIPAF